MSLPLSVAFLISIVLTYFLTKSKIVDIPVNRSSHQCPTPRIGGVAIISSTLISCSLFIMPKLEISTSLIFILLGLSFLIGIGLLDDAKKGGIGYRLRLFVQFITTFCLISALGWLPLNTPFGITLDFLFTFVAYIFLFNASNFADGLNGLLSGSIMIACLFWYILNPDFPSLQIFCSILIAAIFGFFLFNFPWGKIFLGDAGSTFLGGMVGLITFAAASKSSFPFEDWFVQVCILSLIWFDVAFTLLRRLWFKRRLTEPRRDYLSHLLNLAGFSHTQVTLTYVGFVFLSGVLAILEQNYLISFSLWLSIIIITHFIFMIWVIKMAIKNRIPF